MNALQDIITPKVLGIIWITKEKLADRPRPFEEIDYLMDGLLTKFPVKNISNLNQEKKGEENNFFASSNFGKPFFVGQLMANSQKIKENLGDLMKLVSSLKQEKKHILVIDYSSEGHISHLHKKYQEFDFFEIDDSLK